MPKTKFVKVTNTCRGLKVCSFAKEMESLELFDRVLQLT